MADDSYTGGTEAGDEVESPAEDSMANEEREDTFFIPPSMIPGADAFKPGDKLTFTLVGRDADGHLEVEYASKPKEQDNEKSFGDDMRQAVNQPNAALMNPDEGNY